MKATRSWTPLTLVFVACAAACGDDGRQTPHNDAGSEDASLQSDAGDSDGGAPDDGDGADAGPEPGTCAPGEGPSLSELEEQGKAVVLREARSLRAFVVEQDLYLVESGVGLSRMAGGTGEPEVLLSRPSSGPQLGQVKVAGEYLYFTEGEAAALMRLPLANLGAEPVAQAGTPRGYASVIVGDALYGMDGARDPQHELWRQDFVTGAVTVIASVREEFGGFDIAGEVALFTDNTFGVETLLRVPLSGGTPVKLSPRKHFSIQGVKVLDGKAYFADGYALWRSDLEAMDLSQATQRFGSFGPTTSISQGTRGGYGFTDVGDRIYWFDNQGTLGWTSKDRATCGSVVKLTLFDQLDAIGAGAAYVTVRNALYRIAL